MILTRFTQNFIKYRALFSSSIFTTIVRIADVNSVGHEWRHPRMPKRDSLIFVSFIRDNILAINEWNWIRRNFKKSAVMTDLYNFGFQNIFGCKCR